MSLDLIVALASLGFTAIGSVAAIIAIRQNRFGDRNIAVVDKTSAHQLLHGQADGSDDNRKLLDAISSFIFVSGTGRTSFGTLDKMESSVFLDLLTACTIPSTCADIARPVINALCDRALPEKPTVIAVAKEGNVLLAAEIARQLNLGLVIVRTRIPAIRFGNPLEGLLPHGAYVAIVDDVAADGEMLVRTAQRIRHYGGRVEKAFCAVERLDGNSSERLKAGDVDLIAPIRIDEKTLRELRALPTSESE